MLGPSCIVGQILNLILAILANLSHRFVTTKPVEANFMEQQNHLSKVSIFFINIQVLRPIKKTK
jgi:hypothetical protein